jgi:beta-galactosidase
MRPYLGDTFAINAYRVEGVGNNVSLAFEDMDFSSKGAAKLVVYGRSLIDKNTIHIRFENDEGESNQLVEFTQSDQYEECEFQLERMTGTHHRMVFFKFERLL